MLKSILQKSFLTQKQSAHLNKLINRNFCSASRCWKCGSARKIPTDLHCDHCKAIQSPPETRNYFKVFDLDVNFDVDVHHLTRKYRKMQNVLHPDRFTNSSQEEQKISEEYSSLVNKAYGTLQAPMSRALHMLSLNGQAIGEDDKASDAKFLLEVMELNEEIEDAESPESLKRLNEKNKAALNEIIEEISRFFESGDVQRAKEAIIRMKYFNSISKRINDILRERGVID